MHLFCLNDSHTRSCHFDLDAFSNDERFLVVGVFGSTISILSVIENIVLFYVFSTSRKLRRQNYANPVLLAFFDTFVSLGYLCTVSLQFFAFRFNYVELAIFWAKYMRIAYCLQHFALTISNFLLVVASLERYLANGPFYVQKRLLIFMVQNKPIVIVIVLVLAFLLKATIYFENSVLLLPNCAPILRYVPIWRTLDGLANVRFWLRKIFTIIVPFFILVYCNFYIVIRLKTRHRHYKSKHTAVQTSDNNTTLPSQSSAKSFHCYTSISKTAENTRTNKFQSNRMSPICLSYDQQLLGQNNFCPNGIEDNWNAVNESISNSASPLPLLPFSTNAASPLLSNVAQPLLNSGLKINDWFKNEKRGMRIATQTLVMVVGCYLISNSMTTIINIWEYINPNFLRYQHFRAYFMASDLAALLTICGCALRLPIYVINDRRIRNAIFRALIRCRYCYRRSVFQNFDFEKWSIIIVSNSLRSNLTEMLSQMDFATCKGKKSFDQLAVLVRNRQRFLVQMTINLGSLEELTIRKEIGLMVDDDERTIMSNLHEDEDFNRLASDLNSNISDARAELKRVINQSHNRRQHLETIVERWNGNF